MLQENEFPARPKPVVHVLQNSVLVFDGAKDERGEDGVVMRGFVPGQGVFRGVPGWVGGFGGCAD